MPEMELFLKTPPTSSRLLKDPVLFQRIDAEIHEVFGKIGGA